MRRRLLPISLLIITACGGLAGPMEDDLPPDGLVPDAGDGLDAGDGMTGGITKPPPDAGTEEEKPADAGEPPIDAGTVAPAALQLDTSVTALIVEPDGSGRDDQGTSYTDKNYWNFCVPGALTAALHYWKPTNVTAWPAGLFKEPAHAPSTIPTAGTYWRSSSSSGGYPSRGRAYLMYLAMQAKPPSFTTPGVVSFATYPTTGGKLGDARDVLNWEASGHASGWSTFFYVAVYAANATQTKVHTHVKNDIGKGRPVVVFADTGYLPNWSRSLNHAITVVGYDDEAGTYQYVDTCGRRCNGSTQSKNGGVWTISQAKLTQAIQSGAGYLW